MNRGFTYYIKDKSNPDLVYYGSSELPTVEDRMKLHLNKFIAWKKNSNLDYYSSFKILELSNYEYDTIEVVYFDTKYELRQHERLLIEGQVCVNMVIPNRTGKEWKIDNKEKIKQYYIDNKEKFKQYKIDNKEKIKQYNIDNKEKISEYAKQYNIDNKEKHTEYSNQYYIDNREKIKQYRIDNKDKRSEYVKQYYIDNKEKIKQYALQKVTCECGCVVTKVNMERHRKSNKHIKLIS